MKIYLISFFIGTGRPQSAGGATSSPNTTPKSPRKTVKNKINNYISVVFSKKDGVVLSELLSLSNHKNAN
jgi:hypothetical protein